MHKLHSYKGIVLSSRGIGEKNVIVTLFSEGIGLVRAKTMSSRESKGKLKGHITPYSMGVYTLVRGKEGWRLIQAVAQKNFFTENTSLEKKRIIAKTTKLLEKIASEGEGRELFNCVCVAFENIFKIDPSLLKVFEAVLISRILFLLGYFSFDGMSSQLKNLNDFSEQLLVLTKSDQKKLISSINTGLKESQLIRRYVP